MENENMEELDSLNQDEGEETSKTSSEESDSQTDKKDELIKNYKIRAEKVEKENKDLKKLLEDKKEKEVKEISELSTKDVLYLAKADIHEDDLSEVLDWAKFKNISVPDAHKQLRGTLEVRKEERKTAEATQTGPTRKSTQVSGETLIEKARQGQVSDKDEDIDKIVEARMQAKLGKS